MRTLLLLALLSLASLANAALEQKSRALFGHPHDLVLGPDGRYLYVADMDNNRIAVLHPDTLELLGSFGEDELAMPHDVAFDNQGRLWVADSGNNRLLIFTVDGPSGARQGVMTGPFASPEGIAPAPDGKVFTSNVGNHDVVVFDAEGRRLATFTGRDTQLGAFARPHDVELGPDGHLYVADPGNNRILVLTQSLEPTDSSEIRADFNEPKYLALDQAGRLFVADQQNNRVIILDASGETIDTIDEKDGTPLDRPEGIEVEGDTLWVSDTYNHRILRYRWREPAPETGPTESSAASS